VPYAAPRFESNSYARPRAKTAARGYDQRHRNWRRMILNRDPLCVECRKHGKIAAATEADHIKPIDEGGERFDMSNGQGLCKTCHGRKTRAEHARP